MAGILSVNKAYDLNDFKSSHQKHVSQHEANLDFELASDDELDNWVSS